MGPRPLASGGSLTPFLMAYLRLIRLPAVFTAFSDVLAGYVIITILSDQTPRLWPLPALLAASACLYMSGMALNDCFDVDADAVHRPARPIPSGQVSLKAALGLGLVLMILGVLSAMLVGRVAVYAAGFLALTIWLYNGLLQANGVAACFGMATCRFLNVLLGMTASPATLVYGVVMLLPNVLAPAGLLAFYVASVTMISRVEATGAGQGRDELRVRALLILGAVGLAAALALTALVVPEPNVYALATLIVLAALLAWKLYGALGSPEPPAIQALVRTGVLGIVLVDAALIFGHWPVHDVVQWVPGKGWIGLAALGALALLVPAKLLSRVMQIT